MPDGADDDMLSSLPYSIPTLLIGALQIFCIIHLLLKRRDYQWLYLLIFMPFIGALIYLFVHVLPGLRRMGRFTRGRMTGICMRSI